jgi:hypothetical protein
MDDVTPKEMLIAVQELLSKLKAQDEAIFWRALGPHVVGALKIAELPQALDAARRALEAGDAEEALRYVKGIERWYQEFSARVAQTSADLQQPRDKTPSALVH